MMEMIIGISPIFAAFIAVIGGWVAVMAHRKMARERNTLEFIQEYNSDSRVDKAHAFIRENVKGKGADEIADNYKNNRADFLLLMNKFEILAIGLAHGIYDEEMVKKTFKYDIEFIYDDSKNLIDYVRKGEGGSGEGDKAAFKYFEKLATKIKSRRLKT